MRKEDELHAMEIHTSFEAAGMERPSDEVLASRPVSHSPRIKLITETRGFATVKRYAKKAADGKMVYRPGIHLGKNGKLEDFDGSWFEVGAVYK
jgi:hypothetical protein